jgi:hypothetical protein
MHDDRKYTRCYGYILCICYQGCPSSPGTWTITYVNKTTVSFRIIFNVWARHLLDLYWVDKHQCVFSFQQRRGQIFSKRFLCFMQVVRGGLGNSRLMFSSFSIRRQYFRKAFPSCLYLVWYWKPNIWLPLSLGLIRVLISYFLIVLFAIINLPYYNFSFDPLINGISSPIMKSLNYKILYVGWANKFVNIGN